MDTSSGQIFETENSAIRAIQRGETKSSNLVGIPPEFDGLVLGMSRRERRHWYQQNKKRLNLPEWGALHKLGN